MHLSQAVLTLYLQLTAVQYLGIHSEHVLVYVRSIICFTVAIVGKWSSPTM